MHEHGLMERLLARANAEASARGKRLAGVRVRLGALGPEEQRFRADFAHLREHHGLAVTLELEVLPDYPGGVELLGIELVG